MAQYCMHHSDYFVQYLQIQYICFGTDLRPEHFKCCHSRQPSQATDCLALVYLFIYFDNAMDFLFCLGKISFNIYSFK